MGFFATLRKGASADAEPGRRAAGADPTGAVVPARFEAVAEALLAGDRSLAVHEEVGRNLARDGVSLSEAMDGLRLTARSVMGVDPCYESLQALLVAWSEATLSHLHQVSCEDPLTGLASRAHVRSRIAELHRGRTGTGKRLALVVIDERPRDLLPPSAQPGPLARSLRLAQLAETASSVFAGPEVRARVAPDRLVVLVERDDMLARRVGLLRTLFASMPEPATRTRVWVESLPDNDAGAAALLDELARG